MKQLLVDFIKYNRGAFFLYNRLGSFFVKLMGFFIPIDEKKILFAAYGGKKYDDSPKSIYEKMIEMEEFKDYQFVWALADINKELPGNPILVKIDGWAYLKHALSSKFWVINVSAERGLNFKKAKTICINTWHGTPIKKIYGEENDNAGKKKIRKAEKFNLVCSQSQYDREIFARIFELPVEDVIISDLPRNDILLCYTEDDVKSIKQKLNIPQNKKVILYMPTYREYTRDAANACLFYPPIDLEKWESMLGDKYVLLFRAHYLVVKNMEIKENAFVRDVSKYEQLNELYAVSDLMISDYSSAFFDYSILERPELCFAYDLNEYEQHRGFYIDITKLPCEVDKTEDQVINRILTMDYSEASKRTKAFKEKYAPVAGNATEVVIQEILKRYI